MGSPNNFTDGTLVGIVVGGDINDSPPDQSCNMKVFIPGMHGKDVDIDHLAFSTMQKSPSKSSQSTFEGTLDPGSVVFVRKDTGSNQCHIIGTGNEVWNPDARIPGNNDLLNLPQLQRIFERTIDVRIPPNVQEKTVGGVKVRSKEEKNELHRHSLLKGIPANGAIYNLSGAVVPQVKNISSATQSHNNILTPAIASLLPGSSISLGSLMSSLATGRLVGNLAGNLVGGVVGDVVGGIAGDVAGGIAGDIAGTVASVATAGAVSAAMMKDASKQLKSKLTPQMRMSFQSMSMLTQSIETSTGGGFSSGGKIHPETFLLNAVDMLGQCGSLHDMVGCMQRLQYDTSLHGLNKLPSVVIMIDTPFEIAGIPIKMPIQISPTGAMKNIIPAPLKLAIDALSGSMLSPTGFPGINPGQNLFGASAKNMMDMYGRLAGPAQKTAMAMGQTLNTSGVAKRFDNTAKATLKGGGNPLSIMFS